MASSGSRDSGGYQGRVLRFEWGTNSTDPATNTRSIWYRVTAVGGSSNNYYHHNNTVSITGNLVYSGGSSDYIARNTVLASGNITFNQNTDKTLTVDMHGGIYSYDDNINTSYSWQLDEIPRASKINVFTGNDIEGNFKVTYTSYSNNFSNRLRISIPNVKALQTHTYTSGTSFTLDESSIEYLFNYMKNTNSVKLGAVIETYSGNTKIGESSELVNVCKITNANPIFENFTYKDTNTKSVNVTGNNQSLIKGISELEVTISTDNKMTALKEATEKNYVAIIDNINQSTNYSTEDIILNLGTIGTSGAKKLDVRAYDSRNNSTLVSKEIAVYDYEKPIVNAEVSRLNNFEKETTLKINGEYSRLVINNVDKNTIESIQHRYRQQYGEWSEWKNVNFTISEEKFTCNDVILSLDNTQTFEIEVQVSDRLDSTTIPLTVDKGEAIFFISSNKKKCYMNDVEVATTESILNYSTEEQKVGTWIDGKSIYRKTIDIGSLPDNNAKDVEHNIEDLDSVIRIWGTAYRDYDKTFLPLPLGAPVATNAIQLFVTGNCIRTITGAARSNCSGIVTIEYTKN